MWLHLFTARGKNNPYSYALQVNQEEFQAKRFFPKSCLLSEAFLQRPQVLGNARVRQLQWLWAPGQLGNPAAEQAEGHRDAVLPPNQFSELYLPPGLFHKILL